MTDCTNLSPRYFLPSQGAAAQLLRLLTERVRVVGDYQVAGVTSTSVRRLMRQLERQGLLMVRTVMVPPELTIEAPVFSWMPGDPGPHAERLAWVLSSRWKGKPRRVVLAAATRKARLELGGCIGGRSLRRTEASHDLHVTAIYLKLCAVNSERASLWRHEDARTSVDSPEGLVPDAMVGDTVLEFGGQYRAEKLRRIHRGHAAVQRPY